MLREALVTPVVAVTAENSCVPFFGGHQNFLYPTYWGHLKIPIFGGAIWILVSHFLGPSEFLKILVSPFLGVI